MPLYGLFLILEPFEKSGTGALRKILLKLSDKKSVIVGINYHGLVKLPYRIKKFGEFKYEGRYHKV